MVILNKREEELAASSVRRSTGRAFAPLKNFDIFGWLLQTLIEKKY